MVQMCGMGKKRRSRKAQAGFTLIELILAMGIITNILATVLPDMNAMFQEAKLSKRNKS